MDNNNNACWWTVELSVPVSHDNRTLNEERLSTIASLTDSIGSEITTKHDDSGSTQLLLRAHYTTHRELDEIVRQINAILSESEFSGIELSHSSKTEKQAWDTQHYDAFPPLAVGKKLIVMAPWHDKEALPEGRKPIYIFPASAFGTGYHESTQIALSLLEESVKPGDTILDVGTGTGILFIAALKLGAARAIARDIDPVALSETKRNMTLNNISSEACELEEGDLLKGFTGRVNILTANILLNPNLTILPDVKHVLKPKGCAIFSGMTHIESYTFTSVLNSSGLIIEREMRLGDWWGCRAVKA